MPRPKKGEPLSQTPRAIRERETRKQSRMRKSSIEEIELPEPPPLDSALMSREPIGVIESEITAPDVDVYQCGNCQASIDWGQEKCSICEQFLSYDAIAS